ncbi:MAG: transaldolase [Deltaproteobacteria bacterium SG8_13]|nr:MAG: transaldolase [Deltaproteobacteria bacterium SG8_13]
MQDETYKSPLHKMVCISDTDLWNDSCSIKELTYAIEHGAAGATSNPVIVGEVLGKEMPLWEDRIKEIISEMPTADEDQITWKVVEEISIKAADLLIPVYEREKGRKGRLSIQTDPRYYRDTGRIVEQAVYFDTLAPNIIVKIPVTRAGVAAIEEATYRGVSINATVCFCVPQALAVAEAVERGLQRREKEGRDISRMGPVCTIMVGRLDDWLKVVANRDDIVTEPHYLEWAGVAAMKKAYEIYRQRGYRLRLLSAATRNHLHWSEFIGGDAVVTLTHEWQVRFNNSDVEVVPRIDQPVPPEIVDGLLRKFSDFRRSYDEAGMSAEEFDDYGPTVRTLRQFIAGYQSLVATIRDFMLPNPDTKR